MDDGGRVVLGPAARELRRALRPIEWVVLEDVALDARRDDAGALVAPTSARRVAEHLGLTPGAVARALGALRSAGLVTHARQAGSAGRFGLSAYVFGPVPRRGRRRAGARRTADVAAIVDESGGCRGLLTSDASTADPLAALPRRASG